MIEYGYFAMAILDTSTDLVRQWWFYTLKGAWAC